MEITSYQEVFYNTTKPVEVKDVVESLLAFERMLSLTPSVLEKIFPGTKIDFSHIYIENVQSGSLYETFLVKIFFKNEKNLDLFIEGVRKKLHLDGKNMNKVTIVIGLILLALIASGSLYAALKKGDKDKASTVQIEANHNTIINIGAKELDISPDVLKEIIASVLVNKEQAGSDAIKIVRIVKNDPNGEIVINKDAQSKITKEAIQEIPDKIDVDTEVEGEIITHHTGVEVFIRATDLDNKLKGWAAIIPTISHDRLKMQINADLDLNELQSQSRFFGDVMLIEKMKGNEKKKVGYILEKIKPNGKVAKQGNLFKDAD